MADIKTQETQDKTKQAKIDYIVAVGRRKEAVASVRLYKKEVLLPTLKINKGEIIVNGRKGEDYFGKGLKAYYTKPLRITNTEKTFAVSVRVTGGGKVGQAEATALGIARALDKYDREKFHILLKQKGLLTRDSRARQRRKVGMSGKARRRKQSPKR